MIRRYMNDLSRLSARPGRVLSLVFAAALAVTPVHAQSPNVFNVFGVSVDVTAETAAKARDQARAEGDILAFRQLLHRMTLQLDQGRLPDLGREDITLYINDFEVAAEKTSSVRYLARLNYRFKPALVRQLLADFNIPFVETFSRPVLLIPVYQAEGALLLWDDPNPWRDAWTAMPRTIGLVPLEMPLGDLADIAAIGVDQAIRGDRQQLAAIAKRYGASDTMVAHAVLKPGRAGGGIELEVYLTRYGAAQQEQTVMSSFVAEQDETINDLHQRATRGLTRLIEETWKNDNLLRAGRSAVVAVTIPIKRLADWLSVRRMLGQVSVIRKMELVLLSRQEVRVNLHYSGKPGQLPLALEQVDLYLSRDGDTLYLATTPAPGAS